MAWPIASATSSEMLLPVYARTAVVSTCCHLYMPLYDYRFGPVLPVHVFLSSLS